MSIQREISAAAGTGTRINERLEAIGLSGLELLATRQIAEGASSHAGCFVAGCSDKLKAYKALVVIFEELAEMGRGAVKDIEATS